MRFNPPPHWPAPPEGWLPDRSWTPDPEWGQAPEGWSFWVGDDGYPTTGPAGHYGAPGRRIKRKVIGGAAAAFIAGLVLAPGDTTATDAASTVTSTVTSTGSTETVTVEPEPAAPTTVTITEQAAAETVVETETATETVEVTHTETVVEYVEVEGGAGGSVGFYDSGNGSGDSGGSVYYQNCDAARAAGAAPVRVGDPGYGSHLDRDGDGVGCEW